MSRERALGLIVAVTGAAIALSAAKYEGGVLRNIGPGFFPFLAACVLAGLGLLIATRHAGDRLGGAAAVRPTARMAAVPLAVVAFALLVESAGVVLGAMALLITSSCARAGGSWRDTVLLALALPLLAVLIFVWALGVPVPVLPQPFGWP